MWICKVEHVGVFMQLYQPSKFRELVYFCMIGIKLVCHNNNGRFSSLTQDLVPARHHQQHFFFPVTVVKEN